MCPALDPPEESTVLLTCTTGCMTDLRLARTTSLLFPSGSASAMADIVCKLRQ